jgi:hypothetical protein
MVFYEGCTGFCVLVPAIGGFFKLNSLLVNGTSIVLDSLTGFFFFLDTSYTFNLSSFNGMVI